jgi:hypothetical protein
MAADLAGPGYHINRSNLLVLESKADMQKRGQASPDNGDALALTFAQPWRRMPPSTSLPVMRWCVMEDCGLISSG